MIKKEFYTEEVRQKMEEGFKKVTPMVADMSRIIIDTYREGFKNCWELLTGQKFE